MKTNPTTATQKVFCGDNIELLKTYPDNYFDAVVTDPPYGLGKEPNAEEMLRAWVTDGYLEVKGSGFMGKEWDAFIPQPIFWKEVFRVLKHGGHVVSFFGTRTYDWGVMAMRLSGFEIRDCIQWIYGSGFPKSHNISKAIDKIHGAEREILGKIESGYAPLKNGHTSKGGGGGFIGEERSPKLNITIPSTEDAKKWEGWGSALKPANEPIVLARKPLEKGLSIAQNVLKYGTGGLNIDASRIKLEDNYKPINRVNSHHDGSNNEWLKLPKLNEDSPSANADGRFPNNVIFTHSAECTCKLYYKTSDSEEVEEEWTCVEDCPVRILDEQSGESKSVASIRNNKKRNDENIYGGGKGIPQVSLESNYSDEGGASRFFYVAKASQSERNFGLNEFEEKQTLGGGGLTAEMKPDGSYETTSAGGKFGSVKVMRRNTHPTVKPVKLMQYLIRLITPENGIVLDPFNGSGTTGVACKIDGFNYVGMDLSKEYCTISQARIDTFVEEKEFIDECKIFDSQKNQIDGQTSIFDFLTD